MEVPECDKRDGIMIKSIGLGVEILKLAKYNFDE